MSSPRTCELQRPWALARAPWGSATREQPAVCPQAADAAIMIAALVMVTRPPLGFLWQSWIYRDILGYLKWMSDVAIINGSESTQNDRRTISVITL
jgi:hypothetical protein